MAQRKTSREGCIDLSIIIPCYNESHRIIGTLSELFPYLDSQPFSWEVLVMDDASTDGCVALMRRHFDRPEFHIHEFSRNQGKGYSIKVGVEQARGNYVMFMDADLAVPKEEISRLLEWLRGGYDMVVGIRIFDNEITSRLRRVIGFSLLLYINLLLPLPPVPDTQCGFKGFRCEAARRLFGGMRLKGGMFDVEIIMLASLMGLRIKSMPVSWIERSGSTIRLARCLVHDPIDILKVFLNLSLRRYRLVQPVAGMAGDEQPGLEQDSQPGEELAPSVTR